MGYHITITLPLLFLLLGLNSVRLLAVACCLLPIAACHTLLRKQFGKLASSLGRDHWCGPPALYKLHLLKKTISKIHNGNINMTVHMNENHKTSTNINVHKTNNVDVHRAMEITTRITSIFNNVIKIGIFFLKHI